MATLIFMPNSEWAINGDPQWSSDSYGADHATLPYRGRRDKMAAFIDGIARFFEMPGGNGLPNYPGMRSVSWRNSGGTIPYPQIDVEFIGFRRSGIPPAKAVDDTVVVSAQGSGTFDGQAVSGSFTCLSPRTTWSWFEVQQPAATPRFATINNSFDPLTRILFDQLQNVSGQGTQVPYGEFVTVFNSIGRQAQVADYKREVLVPGNLWACSSEVQVALIS